MSIDPLSNTPEYVTADRWMRCAMDAATEQFKRMPSSNPWDYARAIVRALREAGFTDD